MVPHAEQHASHRSLLDAISPIRPRLASIDAIIVPSARPPWSVRAALELAERLNCAIIVLTSTWENADGIAALAGRFRPAASHVVCLPEGPMNRFPVARTRRLTDGAGLLRTTDVGEKRNLGLAIAKMTGMRSVLFLDDDIAVGPWSVRRAAGRLSGHDVVGLRIDGFPDNSVVCHAKRESGAQQDTFVGGGAMIVATDRPTSFFPHVYNEDWFFLLDRSGLRRVALAGRAEQAMFNPFQSEERARSEEFGDVLAEGVFAILDQGGSPGDADRAYWRAFIAARRKMIEGLVHRIHSSPRYERRLRGKVTRSLLAARHQLVNRVTPDLCVAFMRAWAQDLDDWLEFQNALPVGKSVGSAFGHLGVGCVATVHHRWPAWPRQLRRIA